MDLFKTKSDFLDYIFSLQWDENCEPFEIQCWPTGKFSLSDIIGYIENLSFNESRALLSDILLRTERLEFDKLNNIYPQEIFYSLYEEKLSSDELDKALENNYPIANYVYEYLIKRLKTDDLNELTDTPTPDTSAVEGQLIPRPNKEGIIAVEPQKTGLPLCFDTPEFARMIAALIDEGLCKNCNGKYKWLKSASLYGYFVLKTSDSLGIRPSNERLPWKKYAIVFDEANKMHTTAVNFVSKYNNGKGHLNEPEGYDIILKICKTL